MSSISNSASSDRPRAHRAIHTREEFLRRVAGFAAFGLGFIFMALTLGTVGYRLLAGLDWVDSLHNAAMILTGMGPLDPMPDDRAKLFESAYALFSGAAYPAVTALILYPFLHRMLNLMHLANMAQSEGDAP